MIKNNQLPWASGSSEILKHAQELLKNDTDSNRRLAMISIDNAVELMMKTYLGLPSRVTGLSITRKEYQEFSESFPKLLDALEKHGSDRLEGIDLGEIEWYHRLRNQLYHQGNGLTVERDKVEVYIELANILFANLFGVQLIQFKHNTAELLGGFMSSWVELEKVLAKIIAPVFVSNSKRHLNPTGSLNVLENLKIISESERDQIDQLRIFRNKIVHGEDETNSLTPVIVRKIQELTINLSKKIQNDN